MQAKEKKNRQETKLFGVVEDIIGCKWSLTVIDLIRDGVNRPGIMEKKVEGLTTKVLNERLRKLVNYSVVEKTIFPESPPRVEYALTEFGEKFVEILDSLSELDREFTEKR